MKNLSPNLGTLMSMDVQCSINPVDRVRLRFLSGDDPEERFGLISMVDSSETHSVYFGKDQARAIFNQLGIWLHQLGDK